MFSYIFIDFDNEYESKEEKATRAQILFYQQTRGIKNKGSMRGKTEKTKWSENFRERMSSDGEVTLDFISDERNSIGKYTYDPSIMKQHRTYLGRGSKLHPAIDNTHPKQYETNLTKIRNISPIRFQN